MATEDKDFAHCGAVRLYNLKNGPYEIDQCFDFCDSCLKKYIEPHFTIGPWRSFSNKHCSYHPSKGLEYITKSRDYVNIGAIDLSIATSEKLLIFLGTYKLASKTIYVFESDDFNQEHIIRMIDASYYSNLNKFSVRKFEIMGQAVELDETFDYGIDIENINFSEYASDPVQREIWIYLELEYENPETQLTEEEKSFIARDDKTLGSEGKILVGEIKRKCLEKIHLKLVKN